MTKPNEKRIVTDCNQCKRAEHAIIAIGVDTAEVEYCEYCGALTVSDFPNYPLRKVNVLLTLAEEDKGAVT